MTEIMELFRTKAENDYKDGVRVSLDNCIKVCLESLALHREGMRTPLKRYFRQQIEIDKIELKELMEIKAQRK